MSKLDERKKRIRKRVETAFIKKPKGKLSIKLDRNTKLVITYMYGHRYCVEKLYRSGNKHTVSLLTKADKVAEIIIDQKKKAKAPKPVSAQSIKKYFK